LSRIKLREAAMRGDIPGLVKSSWWYYEFSRSYFRLLNKN
jgi:hypothetical protein